MSWYLSGDAFRAYSEGLTRKIEAREKDEAENKASPAYQFYERYEQLTQHVYGSVRSYQNVMLCEVNYESGREDKLPRGRCVILRCIVVLAHERQKAWAVRFIRELTSIAHDTGCLIVACCSPFEIKANDNLNDCLSNELKLKYLGEDMCQSHPMCLSYTESWEAIDKDRQRRMKKRLVDNGFDPINLRDNLGNKKRYGYWTFAFVPPSIERGFLEDISWRLPKRKN